MKILFTGGGSGGHFYPIIAVAEELNKIILERKYVEGKLYFFSDSPYDERALFENGIIFKKTSAGKVRRYFSLLNFFDLFKTFFGIISALWKLFIIFPDVVFSKGGYGSFPTLVAARLLRIPTFIHESDTVPGRVNLWAGKFAKRVAVSFAESAEYFPKDKVAYTGNPIRRELLTPVRSGAREFLGFEEELPVILVLGGSLGAQLINETVVDILPALLEKYQIIHQTGKNNINDVNARVSVVLNPVQRKRYKSFAYLNYSALAMSAGIAKLIISRAGSTLFEIANWGIPSIIVPITDSANGHQHKNAFLYAKSGAAVLLEEANLTGHILLSEINRILDSPALVEQMREGALKFAKPDAARVIAEEIIKIALKHEV